MVVSGSSTETLGKSAGPIAENFCAVSSLVTTQPEFISQPVAGRVTPVKTSTPPPRRHYQVAALLPGLLYAGAHVGEHRVGLYPVVLCHRYPFLGQRQGKHVVNSVL